MKKFILIAGLLFCGLTQAQITVTGNGETINNGETITFNSLGETAKLDLLFSNTSDGDVTMRMKVKTIINNSSANNNLQFCIQPQCFNSIHEGTTLPTNLAGGGLTLTPGATTQGQDNHFRNDYAGDDTSMPVSYELAVITVDPDGNEVDELLSFNYVYDATAASTSDFEALKNAGIALKSTVLNNNIEVDAQQNASLALYNTNGQLVKSAKISTGNQSIDVSSLSAAIYIARFTTEDNKTSQIRVVKQ